MDAGRIKSFSPTFDVRADACADAHARRPDAGVLAANVAPLLALDSLLAAADVDPSLEAAPVAQPRSGVVVNLSLPALGVDMARQLGHAPGSAIDYNHLDPHRAGRQSANAAPAPVAGERISEAGAVALAPDAAGVDRTAPSQLSPELRTDLNPHVLAQAGVQSHNISSAAHKLVASAIAQARDSERLAGYGLSSQPGALATPGKLRNLLLGAIIAAAVILALLL